MAVLQVNDLTYAYPQGRSVGPCSFSVEKGEFLHVTGSSGCGKSTLARCISGLIPHIYHGKMTGEVLINGRSTLSTRMWELSELAGFVFQNPSMQMLGNTVEEEIILGLENLGLDRAVISDRLEESLGRFGLESMRGRDPQTLSGGEQQKLALAAITSRRPPVLVLDEPLSMLDVSAATELTQYLSLLSQSGTTVIAFEHRADYLSSLPGVRVMPLDPAASVKFSRRRASASCPDRACGAKPLVISNICVTAGKTRILENMSLTVQSGSVTAIVGRNGTGKTTLLRAITGLQPFEGSITVDGKKPDFGLVCQNADLQIFNATVRSEILYRVNNPDMELYARLLEILGLGRYENTPPLILSEGEKKRLALATVLIRKPEHGVLLDEPSLGQDAAHKHTLMELCAEIASTGKTVILTTHDLHLASMADRIVVLGPDGIAASGRTGEVLADDSIWARAGMFVPGWITEDERKGITA